MKVIFRFNSGFTKIEHWKEDTDIPRFYKIMKPSGTGLVAALEAPRWVDYPDIWEFRFARDWLDEEDRHVVLYELMK